MALHLTQYIPLAFVGLSIYFEFNSDARPKKFYERIKDGYDTLIWIWKLHLIISKEGFRRERQTSSGSA